MERTAVCRRTATTRGRAQEESRRGREKISCCLKLQAAQARFRETRQRQRQRQRQRPLLLPIFPHLQPIRTVHRKVLALSHVRLIIYHLQVEGATIQNINFSRNFCHSTSRAAPSKTFTCRRVVMTSQLVFHHGHS